MTVPKKSNLPKSNMGDIIKGFGPAGGAVAAGAAMKVFGPTEEEKELFKKAHEAEQRLKKQLKEREERKKRLKKRGKKALKKN